MRVLGNRVCLSLVGDEESDTSEEEEEEDEEEAVAEPFLDGRYNLDAPNVCVR